MMDYLMMDKLTTIDIPGALANGRYEPAGWGVYPCPDCSAGNYLAFQNPLPEIRLHP
jgi:hypothetical protein